MLFWRIWGLHLSHFTQESLFIPKQNYLSVWNWHIKMHPGSFCTAGASAPAGHVRLQMKTGPSSSIPYWAVTATAEVQDWWAKACSVIQLASPPAWTAHSIFPESFPVPKFLLIRSHSNPGKHIRKWVSSLPFSFGWWDSRRTCDLPKVMHFCLFVCF